MHFRFKVIKLMLTNDEQKAQLKKASVYIEITPRCAWEDRVTGRRLKLTEKSSKNLYLSGSLAIIVLKIYPAGWRK